MNIKQLLTLAIVCMMRQELTLREGAPAVQTVRYIDRQTRPCKGLQIESKWNSEIGPDYKKAEKL